MQSITKMFVKHRLWQSLHSQGHCQVFASRGPKSGFMATKGGSGTIKHGRQSGD